MKRINIRTFANSLTIRIGALILAAILLVLVVISPIALQQLAHVHGVDWTRLSSIGQTYGAVSAFLTALALGGVVISLLYQARDVKAAREQASRTFHNELLKMEMESPFYMDVLGIPWGQTVGLPDYDSLRRNHLVHMWVSYWEGRYELREMSDSMIRYMAASELFVSDAARQYWSLTRKVKLENYKGRRRRFSVIMDEEYSKAIASGTPAATINRSNPSNVTTAVSRQMSSTESKILICFATGAAILAGRLLGRRFSRKSR
jgi:hypothetical protein